jgi:hypothetical protein
MPKSLKRLRRSTRNGRRSSTRVKPKKVLKKNKQDTNDVYDRDLGGYKFVCVHKDNKWHQTKRAQQQVQHEKNLCEKMKNAAGVLVQGYAVDDFFVEEDTDETTAIEETDALFAQADAIDVYSSDEELSENEEEWSENEK